MLRFPLTAKTLLCSLAATLVLAPASASPSASGTPPDTFPNTTAPGDGSRGDLSPGDASPGAAPQADVQAPTTVHRIRGFLPDLKFSLTGPQGKTLTQEALEDKVVLLFFGYASCPDICPTTMAQLSQVVHNLGDQADQAQIVFISVDPHRDTPDILNAYVSAFNDHAIGLTGSEKQIADVARRYRVAYQIEKPTGSDPENYEVTHARGIYIFDQKGRARFLASDSESIEALTASVRELLG